MESIPNKIKNHLGILCDINLYEENDNRYIIIKVNPYSNAISLRGRYYFRTGSTKIELTGIDLNEFLLKKSGKTWDDVIEDNANLNDIDVESLLKFVKVGNQSGRMPYFENNSTTKILENLRLVSNGKLKRAAIILFAKDPAKFYPNIVVKIGKFGKDSTELIFQEILEGNLVHLIHEVENQLKNKFLIDRIEFKGLLRYEKGQYPISVLREMLLNALVHRQYMGSHIQIRVFEDRISIWNEGNLPNGISLESLKNEHNSKPRNPIIADVCFKAGYIDTWGRGTLKIYNECKNVGLPEPEIILKDGGIEVTIFNGQKGGQKGGQISGQIDRQVEILQLITNNPTITRKELSNYLEIAESAIQKHIKSLVTAKKLKRVGTKNGYWKILK